LTTLGHIPGSVTAGAEMADGRRMPTVLLRSLRVQGLTLLVVLILLPALLYSIFENIESERRDLLVTAVQDAGTAIAAGLAPELQTLQPSGFDGLDSRLARFADPRRRMTLLFHPTGSAATEQFFFVASVPPVSAEQLGRERERLVSLGVLNELAHSCAGGTSLAERVTAENGSAAVITSITGVAGQAGCWAIVIAVNSGHEIASIMNRPAEVSRELMFAALVYVVMAGLILAIFVGVWANLRRFRTQALATGAAGRFLDVTNVPEMVPVARAIDGMVHRLRDTAEMLRQAAEDDAHAFKGPIATIRQAVEPLLQATPQSEQLQMALPAVQAALDRLDGLVRSIRRLDTATADLLEISHIRVDLSALLHELIADSQTMWAAYEVSIVESLAAGVGALGEADAIESIFENLLDNALGFSPRHGKVRVTLDVTDETAQVNIEDEGPGVPGAALGRIFERYYSDRRAMPRSEMLATGEPAHFGIGLWIARQNARALGGEITVANRVPRGLSVRVQLPLAARGAAVIPKTGEFSPGVPLR
jgi:two-component system, OmpR family, sensor histidine kinase ChvG